MNWLEIHLTVCYYHFTYAFQSDPTLYSFLNVKELLAQNKCNIWSLSDSNGIETHNHLVCKQALKHLAKLVKWLSCVLSTGHLTVCYYHVTYALQSESTFYSCWNIKERLTWNKCVIWSLSESNEIRKYKRFLIFREL